MQESQDFLAPRLTGKRYEQHTLPLDMLEDFSAYEELVIEVAKWLYLQANPDRKRVPKGFNDGLTLHLSGEIGEGSSIPKILLVAAMAGMFPKEGQYFLQARDIIAQTIASADQTVPSQTLIPDYLLKRFNRIGKNLEDGETIEFAPSSQANKAVLNKAVRKRLILASGERYFENPISLRATVSALDKKAQSCSITFAGGQSLDIPTIPPQHYNILLTAFNNYEQQEKILIKGTGRFNKSDNLESIEVFESITRLEPLDVPNRLEELSQLEDGWYNGTAKALSAASLEWFENMFEEAYETTLPLPYIYPRLDGGLQLEWNNDGHAASIDVNLQTKNAEYFHLVKGSGDFEELEIDLSIGEGWELLNQKLLGFLSTTA